jgi:hypothetical protein
MNLRRFASGLLAFFSSIAFASAQEASAVSSQQDATKAYITNTYSSHSQTKSPANNLESGSIVTVTKKIVLAASISFDGGSDLRRGDDPPGGAPLPKGTNLPPSGNPGDIYTSAYCVPHNQSTIYVFKWVPTPSPGHWQVIKVKNDQDASTECN